MMINSPKKSWRNILSFSKPEPLLTFHEAREILGEEHTYGLSEALAVFGKKRVPKDSEVTPLTARQLRLLKTTGFQIKIFLRYAPLGQIRAECMDVLSIDRGVLDLYRQFFDTAKDPSYRVVIGPLRHEDEWELRQLVKSLGLKLTPASLTTGLTGRLIDKVVYEHSPEEVYLVEETKDHRQVIVVSDAGKICVKLARKSIEGWARLFEIRAA